MTRLHRHNPPPHALRAALLTCVVLGCSSCSATATPDVASDDTNDSSAADAAPWTGPSASTTRDFLVTSISFAVPNGLKAQTETVANPCGIKANTDNSLYEPLILQGQTVDGFDLDGADTQDDGPCPHRDFIGPNGATGIDYGFLHVMDMIRPARPGQTIETVLRSAPAQGLVRIGIRLTGVDNIENDDEIGVLIVTTSETPLLGADGQILAGSSVRVDEDLAFRSFLHGKIVNGIMDAGPGDVTLGKINLLVAQNRIIALKEARVRASVKELPSGDFEVDARIAGWWQRDSMTEAIGTAILAIGANGGELACVLDKHADHSSDGKTCDSMSTMMHARAVSGFITGLPDDPGGK